MHLGNEATTLGCACMGWGVAVSGLTYAAYRWPIRSVSAPLAAAVAGGPWRTIPPQED